MIILSVPVIIKAVNLRLSMENTPITVPKKKENILKTKNLNLVKASLSPEMALPRYTEASVIYPVI